MIQKILRIRIGVGIAAIFLAGGIAGGFVGAGMEQRQLQQQAEIEQLPNSVMNMLDARLDLSPAQIETLTPIVDDACDELRVIFQENRKAVSQVLHKYYELIEPSLEGEQAEILGAMEAELTQRAGELQ